MVDKTPKEPLTARQTILDTAKTCVLGDRNNTYGPPTQDFARTAALWTDLGFTFNGEPVKAHHVAMAMMALKLSRLVWSPQHIDSWIDAAGYSACGFECTGDE
jgi:Domain of unknown function (DUF6378)